MAQTPTHPVLCDFLDDMGYAPSTTRSVTSHLCIFERWATAHQLDILRVGHRDLQAFLDQRGVGPSALHKAWQVLDSLYGWMSRPHPRQRRDRPGANLLEHNPMLKVPAPHVPDKLPGRRYAQADAVAALLTYYDRLATRRRHGSGEFVRAKRNAAVLALVAGSGMRIGEVPWIDLHHLVRAGDDYVAVIVGGDDGTHTKNRKGREVPVSEEASRYLRRYLRYRGTEPGPLFLGREAHTVDPSGRMTTRALQEVFKRATKRVGVSLSPHDLRREWTATAHRNGATADDIMLVGGWSKKETMLTYAGPAAGTAAARRLRAVAS